MFTVHLLRVMILTFLKKLSHPKGGTSATQNVSQIVEQRELSFIAVGVQKGTATLEDCWTVSYKTKYEIYSYITTQQSHSLAFTQKRS